MPNHGLTSKKKGPKSKHAVDVMPRAGKKKKDGSRGKRVVVERVEVPADDKAMAKLERRNARLAEQAKKLKRELNQANKKKLPRQHTELQKRRETLAAQNRQLKRFKKAESKPSRGPYPVSRMRDQLKNLFAEGAPEGAVTRSPTRDFIDLLRASLESTQRTTFDTIEAFQHGAARKRVSLQTAVLAVCNAGKSILEMGFSTPLELFHILLTELTGEPSDAAILRAVRELIPHENTSYMTDKDMDDFERICEDSDAAKLEAEELQRAKEEARQRMEEEEQEQGAGEYSDDEEEDEDEEEGEARIQDDDDDDEDEDDE